MMGMADVDEMRLCVRMASVSGGSTAAMENRTVLMDQMNPQTAVSFTTMEMCPYTIYPIFSCK